MRTHQLKSLERILKFLPELFSWSVLLAIILYGFRLRMPAFNPEALWLDDAWVGLACRVKTWREAMMISTSSPTLFTAINRLICSAVSDQEIALQILPLVSSLLQVPLMYMIVVRLAGSRLSGLLAALIVCVTPSALNYSVRAKQYLVDSLAVSALILIFTLTIQSRTVRTCVMLCLGSIVTFLLSYVSVLLSWPLLHLTALEWIICHPQRGANGGRFKRSIFALLVTFDAVVVTYSLLILRGKRNGHLITYWQKYFLPLDGGVVAYLQEAVTRVVEVFLAAIPIRTVSMTPRVILLSAGCVGIFALAHRREHRTLLMGMLCSYIGAVLLATLQLYPLGGGRTDIFLIPVSIILICTGLQEFSEKVGALLFKSRLLVKSHILRRGVVIGIHSLLLVPLVSHVNKYSTGSNPLSYPNEAGSKRYVHYLGHALRRDGGAVIHPMGRYSLCLYGRWRCQVHESPLGWGWGLMLPGRAPVTILQSVSPDRVKGAIVDSLHEIRAKNLRRVFFFGVHLKGRTYFFDALRRELRLQGFRQRVYRKRKGALLVQFSRFGAGAKDSTKKIDEAFTHIKIAEPSARDWS